MGNIIGAIFSFLIWGLEFLFFLAVCWVVAPQVAVPILGFFLMCGIIGGVIGFFVGGFSG
jgi:hypothetical protein